jgi:hypothetical protein
MPVSVTHRLVVAEALDWPGRFCVTHDGVVLVQASVLPTQDAARVLLEMGGVSPRDRVEFYYDDTLIGAGSVATAARLPGRR